VGGLLFANVEHRPSGEGFHLQVSGGKNDDWKVDEEIEREYCEELGLRFGERVERERET
jgi:hypothetical protein